MRRMMMPLRYVTSLGSARVVEWPGAVCADGEDSVERKGRRDRVLLSSGSRDYQAVGSAHDEAGRELLKVAARPWPSSY
jgi:hypothetical protein